MSLTTSDVPVLEVPGFDAAVRDVLTSAAASVGADIDLPEGEIEYVAMPDLEISPSPDFEELAAPTIHENDPTGVTDVVAEHWPEQAKFPDCFLDLCILSHAITSERPRREGDYKEDSPRRLVIG